MPTQISQHMSFADLLDGYTKPKFVVPASVLLISQAVAYAALKSTFFMLYLQLFDQLGWMRICAWIGLCINLAAYSGFLVTLVLHVAKRDLRGTEAIAIPMSSVGLATDLMILLLPLFAVARLHMTTRKKLGAIVVFGSGILYVMFLILPSSFYSIRQLILPEHVLPQALCCTFVSVSSHLIMLCFYYIQRIQPCENLF